MKRLKDPFARKMVYGSLVYGGVLLVMFAVLTVVYLHTRPRCSERVVSHSFSGARWTATLMERRCGEEAPFFAHVNLHPAGKDLWRGFFSGTVTEGEVFAVEQDAFDAGVSIRWSGPNTLVIHCARCSASFIRKRQGQWNGVDIEYELPFH